MLLKPVPCTFWSAIVCLVFCTACGAVAPLSTQIESSRSEPCVDGIDVHALAQGFPTEPVRDLPDDLSLSQAYCIQEKLVSNLSARHGEPIGYKVGFTGKETQTRFGVEKPVTGVLLEKMFVPHGGTLTHDFAYRPLVEPDLMVVVKDEGIMEATSLLGVAAKLDTLHACLEMPALQLESGETITGAKLAALNVAAVHMVMGPGIVVESTPEFVKAVGSMSTVFVDGTGKEIQRAPAANLMGHPFEVVLWLIKEFKGRGLTLKAGDRISLGSVGKLFPVAPKDQRYVYSLEGLPGGVAQVEIGFRGPGDVSTQPKAE